ncbi:MAG: hypothetical protein ABIJ75_01595 [Actinomycetota bacterium]
MHRLSTLLLGLALIAAACGDDAAATSTTVESAVTASSQPAPSQSSTTSTAPPETSAPAATPATTAAPAAREPLPDEAVAAPDVDLMLGEGGTFTLSAADKPVYLVFWAEW